MKKKESSVVELEVGEDGVAIISINNPPVNLLTVNLIFTLKDRIEEALLRDEVKAIVLIGSNGKFSGGFDVTAFGGRPEGNKQMKLGFVSIDFLTDTLEASKKPIVAAIDGPTFGGGLELALACHARISTVSAKLGLTELEYGVIPGLGGTQRLPRLVSIHKALEMILMSKRVSGKEALDFCLVDAIAPADMLLGAARQWALDILECRRPWVVSLYKTDRLEPLAEARRMFRTARTESQKQNPNLFHPLLCIDVMEEGIVSGPRNGLWKEAKVLEEVRQSDICRGLVHIFFARYRTSKVPEVDGKSLLPRNMKKVAIVGGGLVGSGIATVLILSNFDVVMKEVNEKCLSDGIGRVKANLQRYVEVGKISHQKQKEGYMLLKGVLSYDSFNDVDLVIEATEGNVYLKQQIFAELERYCPRNCIFSSNNSSNLNLIGERTKSHNRIVGVNFFSPAPVMPLLEVVRTDRTSPQVIVDLIAFGRKIGKTTVVVGNSTGFAINRMFFLYLQSAIWLIEHGADVYVIDQAMTRFGMQLGPFRMVDLLGLRVTAAIAAHFVENFPDRSYKSRLIQVMEEDNREGEPNHRGFYVYNDNYKASPDPEVMKLIDSARNISNVSINSKLDNLSEGDIAEMVLLPVLNEACRITGEGIAYKASDLDVASVLGMGFPAYRGGIIFWADSLGTRYICSQLENWSKVYGELFKPCAYLVQRAYSGTSLGSQVQQVKSHL
ncbi:hypothetical protein ACH5RR_010811 [Cinchona calisaya]|uniref:3-hydroxyacyl-CoA dehydrogenase n=1 Tax=Cinchona calisaya TaxID=153742 RepID=A0ABD3AK03_9GENT